MKKKKYFAGVKLFNLNACKLEERNKDFEGKILLSKYYSQ